MAYNEALKKVSYDADASLAQYTGISGTPGAASPNYGHLYSIVKLTGSHTVGLAVGSGLAEQTLGVLHSKPQKVGSACAVALIEGGGVSKVMCGTGGLAVGDRVKPDASGHGVTAAATDNAIGICVEAGAAGALASVALVRSTHSA